MAFPTSPTNGQIYNQYVYDTTRTAWMKVDPGKYFDIGFIYTQYPGKQSPSEKGWYGSWTNVSSSYAGDFFRAEGGSALAFDAVEQSDQMQGHGHVVNGVVKVNYAYSSNSAALLSGADGNWTPQLTRFGTAGEASAISSTPIEATPNGTPRTGEETRPINRTIRVWERTA